MFAWAEPARTNKTSIVMDRAFRDISIPHLSEVLSDPRSPANQYIMELKI